MGAEEKNDAMEFAVKAKGYTFVIANCIYSYGVDSRWSEKVKEDMAELELEKHRNKVGELVNEINEKYSDVPFALNIKKILQEGLSRLEKIALPYVN